MKTKKEVSRTWSITTGKYTMVLHESAPTLLSRDYKDAPCVCVQKKYIPGKDGYINGKWI